MADKKTVLLVDDHPLFRDGIKALLKQHSGFEVIGEAGNGQECLAKVGELKPDLVTMDITMRGMDGFTAAKRIMNLDEDAKIVILSNLDEEKYRDEVDRIGAIGLVNKHNSDQILKLVGDAAEPSNSYENNSGTEKE